ncbi:MAG: response regulator [Salibacteraceae bacterium]
MGKVKIMVVEDEIVVADNICMILEQLGYDVLDPVINYTDAVALLEQDRPDLALLDIQLAGSKDGIDLAWKIKEDFDLPFVFLTSNADPRTIERAKMLTPPAYLVKPFNRDDLYTSIELALFNFQKSQSHSEEGEEVIIKDALFVKDRNLFHKVKFEEILFAKSEHVYVELYVKSGKKLLIRTTMNRMVERLPKNFFRVHRSYTINLDFLDTIHPAAVEIGGHQVPVGKTFREQLMRVIHLE